jgi:large subunit ribosomal protein L13
LFPHANSFSLMKTYSVKAGEIEHQWFVVDAADQVLGRLATEIARVLRGKHKPTYTPHLDTGDYVVVINADRIRLTGNKPDQKTYFKHTGYMGNDRFIPFRRMMERHPERVIELAVKGMLPKNALGRQMRDKLRVYAGTEHPHQSQQPTPLTFAASAS